MELNLAWWNTGLSPRRGGAPSAKKRAAALEVISHLLDGGADILGLCEVSDDDLTYIGSELGDAGFGMLAAQAQAGRSQFDLGLVYRLSKVASTVGESMTTMFGGNTLRLSVVFHVEVAESKFAVALLHWPSRIRYASEDKIRLYIAQQLRARLDELVAEKLDGVIVMGDFNDEPFNSNLAQTLLAIRDRELAQRDLRLFYNPFWAHMAGKPVCGEPSDAPFVAGSHHYKRDFTERWWMFDQMLFSSSLVDTNGWYLDEGAVAIGGTRHLRTIVMSKKGFDHLPIMAALRRDENG